eukprot:2115576-Prymnesium_polylepis.1
MLLVVPDTMLHQPTALPTLATQSEAPDATPRTNPTPAYSLKVSLEFTLIIECGFTPSRVWEDASVAQSGASQLAKGSCRSLALIQRSRNASFFKMATLGLTTQNGPLQLPFASCEAPDCATEAPSQTLEGVKPHSIINVNSRGYPFSCKFERACR